jgi:prevent-host-death family protein
MSLREVDPRGLVSGVSVGELNRRTSDVVRQVESGARAIVTNHGRPVAALLSVAEGIDVLLVHLAVEPRVRAGAIGSGSRGLTVELTAQAGQELAELPRSRQVMLMTAARRAAIHSGRDGSVVVSTPQDLGAAVAISARNLLLVYAVLSRRGAMERLLGPDLFERWRARDVARLSHGRAEMAARW